MGPLGEFMAWSLSGTNLTSDRKGIKHENVTAVSDKRYICSAHPCIYLIVIAEPKIRLTSYVDSLCVEDTNVDFRF